MSRFARVAAVALPVAVAAGKASAQVAAPDSTELVSFVESLWVPIAAVVGAFTTIVLGIKGWKLIRRA